MVLKGVRKKREKECKVWFHVAVTAAKAKVGLMWFRERTSNEEEVRKRRWTAS